MDTDDGTPVTVACFQPPDAENRTSGGVEGSRAHSPRPHPILIARSRFRPLQAPRGPVLPGMACGIARSCFDACSGWLSQADVLIVLEPVLTVRSDTFLVRAYGTRKGDECHGMLLPGARRRHACRIMSIPPIPPRLWLV